MVRRQRASGARQSLHAVSRQAGGGPKILFDENPPIAAVAQGWPRPRRREQATTWTTASRTEPRSRSSQMTPTVPLALIEAMSPEVINNPGALSRPGDGHPDPKTHRAEVKDGRVAFKAERRRRRRISRRGSQKLEPWPTRRWANPQPADGLFIDKSGPWKWRSSGANGSARWFAICEKDCTYALTPWPDRAAGTASLRGRSAERNRGRRNMSTPCWMR